MANHLSNHPGLMLKWANRRVMLAMTIGDNVRRILRELPEGVRLVAAAKTRTPAEVLEAVAAGVGIIGENYVQEAERAYATIGKRAEWHLIGHLQKNKAKRAAALFDMVETVDSLEIATELDRHAAEIGKQLSVLIEVNSGRETAKSGVLPEEVPLLAGEVAALRHLSLMGLMTMGPLSGDPEEVRPCFREVKRLFDELKKSAFPGAEMHYLSMGMTDSYQVAIEEGANLVRIGSGIFGARLG
jgi:pyridoxal phosphate enzyme (YggS family)